MDALSFDTPESRVVQRADYDPSTETLTVEIHGTRYRYSSIPASLWEEFDGAPSKGAFLTARIRPWFSAHRVP